LDGSEGLTQQQGMLKLIHDFVGRSPGLRSSQSDCDQLRVIQVVDGKALHIFCADLTGVLSRWDDDGNEFIQVNFSFGKKILLTSTLIGFKPLPLSGLDASHLPRVVTTPDIISVFEAIQDSIDGNMSGTKSGSTSKADAQELALLKKLYEAVVLGGEAIGLDLHSEREWLNRVPNYASKASA
jgi:hypothetical protein